jgi:site-specific recombinase XerC
MNASDYLQRSTLYRKLIHGPHGKFAQVYAARLSNEGLGRQCTWRSLSLFRELMDWHVGSGHVPSSCRTTPDVHIHPVTGRRRLLQRADTDQGRGIIEAEIHLAIRSKLFRQTELPLYGRAARLIV